MTPPHAFEIPRAASIGRVHAPSDRGTILVIIGVLKLIKGVTMFLLGLMALHLLHKDLATYIDRWSGYLHMDPNGKWINWLLIHAFVLSARKLLELGVGLFVYSGLFLTEGTGLVLRKHWAEYFTTICTGLFIPLELYEIGRRAHAHRHVAGAIILTVINIAIVVYLIVRLRREWHHRQAMAGHGFEMT